MDEYEAIVSDEARRQMGDCVRFIAKDDAAAAEKLKDRMISEIRSLSEMPARFPFFNEEYLPWNKYHKLFVEKYYLVLYQVKDTTVYVDYIIDCRRDYQWLIR